MGVFTVDAALIVRTWDGWLAAHTGIPADAACGRPLIDVVPSLVERGLLRRFEDVLATGQVQVLAPAFHHYLIPCPPVSESAHFGEMRQRATLGPLREQQQIVGVMATIEDVTARLDAEKALADALRGDDAAKREAAARQLADAEHLADPMALTEALRDDSWKVRGAAVRALTRHADRDMLGALLGSLQQEHGNFNVLSSALQLLAASDIDVTASLAALVADADPDLRMQAALALGQQDQPAAAHALVPLLDDPDVNVRFHAIEALGRLRAADAVDRLAEIAESDDFFLAFPAIDALAQIRDSRVASRLVPLLASAELCDAAAGALGEVGEAESIGPLVTALNAGRGDLAVIRALARLHERYERFGAGSYVVDLVQKELSPAGGQRVVDALGRARAADVGALVLVLGWLQGTAVQRALTRLLAHPDIRPGVIEAIVRQGAGIVDLLIEQLAGAEDDDTRAAAIGAMARIGDRRAVPALTEALHGDRGIAVAAAGALAAVGDTAAFEPLMALVDHPDVVVRQAVIGALNSLGHPDMAARVCQLLSSPDAAARESAVRVAGYFGYPDCLEQLFERCSDPDENVRRAALEQLPHLDTPRAAALLARALHEDTPRARASAAQALGRLGRAVPAALLIEAANDSDTWVRYFAVRALARDASGDAVAHLGRIAAGDAAMPVRLAAIEGLGTIEAVGVFEALAPHLEAPDRTVATAALSAVGCLADGRAVEALLAALRSSDPSTRRAAVNGLACRPDAARIDALAWTAGADPDPTVADAAVDGLARLASSRDESADQAIAALLSLTVEPAKREAALIALSQVRHRVPSVAAGLRAPDPEVRRSTVEALSRLHHAAASAAIREALGDSDAGVRAAAVTALHRLGVRGLSQVFATLSRDDPSREVRRAASAALAQERTPPPGADSPA